MNVIRQIISFIKRVIMFYGYVFRTLRSTYERYVKYFRLCDVSKIDSMQNKEISRGRMRLRVRIRGSFPLEIYVYDDKILYLHVRSL
jgi:hypothetical protein